MNENELIIKHLEFEEEKFQIINPVYNINKRTDGVFEFTIGFDTNNALKRDTELKKVVNSNPNFEATAIISADDQKLKEGQVVFQKEGYDYDIDENLSVLYYFGHESVEELRVEILDIDEKWIIVNIQGKAIVNGSNGDFPDAELFVYKTKFYRDNEFARGFS